MNLSLAEISNLLGASSICCWLGSQLPQVVQNYKQKSCHGLAVYFLFNWFMGDFSNLLGCLMTDQLPFQTYLASYFVAVDLTLCFQYWYYYHPLKPEPLHYAHHVHSRARTASTATIHGRPSHDRASHRYRTLSAVAANVATNAAFAAQYDHSQPRFTHRYRSYDRHRGRSSSRPSLPREDSSQTEDSAMVDSFHSERVPSRSRRISWSNDPSNQGTRGPPITRNTAPHHSSHHQVADALTLHEPFGRGRSAYRDGSTLHEQDPSQRRSSRATRHGANLVLMSACALFGFGALAGLWHGDTTSFSGKVLSSGPKFYASAIVSRGLDAPLPEIPHESPSMERIFGRIFAWLCATLYLTSRLPQIWKNYTRKSVEGLSMYLFVFAFFGNSFYVASILTSPKLYQPPPVSTDFIRESIPYLIGSAGTLMFDSTIVAQSFLYKPKAHRRSTASHSQAPVGDEEVSLLRESEAPQTSQTFG